MNSPGLKSAKSTRDPGGASPRLAMGEEMIQPSPDRKCSLASEETPAVEIRQRITDTPEFRAWFGDSKVVDPEGKPLVVYHGTQTPFSSFRPLSYFTAHPNEAAGYALQGGEFERAIGQSRCYRFVAHEGLVIPGPCKSHEVVPYLQDYQGPDDVVFPCEDGLAYRHGGRHFILTGLRLEWEPWPPEGVDVEALPSYERMSIAWNQMVHVVPGTSDLEKMCRQEIREAADAAAHLHPAMMPVYLSLQNPYITDDHTWAAQFLERASGNPGPGTTWLVKKDSEVARLKDLGHDGIIAPSDSVRLANAFGEGPGRDVLNYIIFEPTQVKSVFNRGTFNPTDPDARA